MKKTTCGKGKNSFPLKKQTLWSNSTNLVDLAHKNFEMEKVMKRGIKFCIEVSCLAIALVSQTGCQSFGCHHCRNRPVSNGSNFQTPYDENGAGIFSTTGKRCERPQRPADGGGDYHSYRVCKGDSYWSIARRFDIPLKDLLDANGATKDTVLRIGQELQVPERKVKPNTEIYVVQRGDSLSLLANQCNCSIQELRELNSITNDQIQIGQRLFLPATSSVRAANKFSGPQLKAGETLYIVRRGDTLSAIAHRYGMRLHELASLNGITRADNIRGGQRLKVIQNRQARDLQTPVRTVAPTTPKPAVDETSAKDSDDDLLDLFDEEDLYSSIK